MACANSSRVMARISSGRVEPGGRQDGGGLSVRAAVGPDGRRGAGRACGGGLTTRGRTGMAAPRAQVALAGGRGPGEVPRPDRESAGTDRARARPRGWAPPAGSCHTRSDRRSAQPVHRGATPAVARSARRRTRRAIRSTTSTSGVEVVSRGRHRRGPERRHRARESSRSRSSWSASTSSSGRGRPSPGARRAPPSPHLGRWRSGRTSGPRRGTPRSRCPAPRAPRPGSRARARAAAAGRAAPPAPPGAPRRRSRRATSAGVRIGGRDVLVVEEHVLAGARRGRGPKRMRSAGSSVASARRRRRRSPRRVAASATAR